MCQTTCCFTISHHVTSTTTMLLPRGCRNGTAPTGCITVTSVAITIFLISITFFLKLYFNLNKDWCLLSTRLHYLRVFILTMIGSNLCFLFNIKIFSLKSKCIFSWQGCLLNSPSPELVTSEAEKMKAHQHRGKIRCSRRNL